MKLVEDYKKLVAERDEIKEQGLAKRKGLYEVRNAKMDELTNVAVEAQLALEKYDEESKKEINDVSFEYSRMMNAKMDEIKKYESFVDMIIGKGKREILRLHEEDIKFVYSNFEISMFDVIHDTDAISLYAVIISNNSKYCNDLKHVLYVFGFGENGGYVPEIEHLTDIKLVNVRDFRPNVSLFIMKSDDYGMMLQYYNEKIKGLVVDNEKTSSLRKIIMEEEMAHGLREKLFAEYTLDDVLDLISYRCPDCGRDAVVNSKADSMMREHYCCFCKAEFVKVRGD